MKKGMIMIVSFCLIIGQAIAGQAELHIKSNGNRLMTIYIDGQQVANMNTQVSINGLADGNHSVEIFSTQGNGWFQNTHLSFSGNIYLPHNTLTKFKLKQNNQLVLQEQIVLYTPPVGGCGTPPPFYNPYPPQNTGCGVITSSYNNPTYGNYSCSNGGYYDNYTYNNTCTQLPSCGCGNCGGSTYDNYNPYGNSYSYNNAMNEADFNQLLTSISNQWFSSDMMSIYEQALNTNHFSAAQVKQLVNIFTYDSDKLKVAKTAYTKTVDKENYFVVYDALDYSSSVNQLTAYIATL